MKRKELDKLNLAATEFYELVSTFLLPLIQTEGELKIEFQKTENTELVSFIKDKSLFRFFPCISKEGNRSPFYCEIKTISDESLKKQLIAILREMLKVAEYNCFWSRVRRQRSYGTTKEKANSFKERALQLAFEFGLCSWIAPKNAEAFHAILYRLTEWSQKTYEGKKMPFGIIVDLNKELPTVSVSYKDYLKNNSSAVFSDGISSGVLLDRNGNLSSFIPLASVNEVYNSEHRPFVPYQYEKFAQKCISEAVGIIVQPSGDIIIIKEKAICLAKRGNRWVSFSWDLVFDKLKPYFLWECASSSERKIIKEKVKDIYCTLLDVSFSHTGGCFGIIDKKIQREKFKSIIQEGDLFTSEKEKQKDNIKIATQLLSGEDGIARFFDADRVLRKEIMSLDGATVISPDGEIFCTGTIVGLSGGSTDGARTAAAKKLAEFGVGIKISEDGYIDAYGASLFHDNEKIMQLFAIK